MKNRSLASTVLLKSKLQKRSKLQMALNQKGSVLLEALIAILIFSFGILAISGLQGAMMQNTADATFRSEASYIVQQELGRLLTNPLAIGANYSQSVPSLPSGNLTTTALTGGRIQFLVTWQVTGEAQHTYEAVTSIFTAR